MESLEELRQLSYAIDRNDITGVQNLMTRNPDLHKAPLGYGKDGPLTLAAECGIPTESRLSIVRWMIENGSDVHQGGDGPLMRAALSSNRIPTSDRAKFLSVPRSDTRLTFKMKPLSATRRKP